MGDFECHLGYPIIALESDFMSLDKFSMSFVFVFDGCYNFYCFNWDLHFLLIVVAFSL